MFDGAVAKASDRASQRGSFFDSVIDRISDAALLMGAAYYLTAHNRGQLVLLPFAILTTTFLISYQRSKAESLGLTAKGGLMERAERMLLMGSSAVAHVGSNNNDGAWSFHASLESCRKSSTTRTHSSYRSSEFNSSSSRT
jgi:phosphatidylglycerophosphate synthase